MEYKYDIAYWLDGEIRHDKLVLSTPITDYDKECFEKEHNNCVIMAEKLVEVTK